LLDVAWNPKRRNGVFSRDWGGGGKIEFFANEKKKKKIRHWGVGRRGRGGH